MRKNTFLTLMIAMIITISGSFVLGTFVQPTETCARAAPVGSSFLAIFQPTEANARSRSSSRSSSRSRSKSGSKPSKTYTYKSVKPKPAVKKPVKDFGAAPVTTNKGKDKKPVKNFGAVKAKDKKAVKNFGAVNKKSAVKPGKRAAIMTKKKAAKQKATLQKSKAYASKTTKKDWNDSRSGYMKGKKTHTPKYDNATRYSGNQRTVIVNRYNNSYGGFYFADPYNHGMMFSFSSLWWYHHWGTIDHGHHRNDARFRELEAEIQELKAQNVAVNADYKDEGMDEGVMHSDGYLEGAKSGKITEASYTADGTRATAVQKKSHVGTFMKMWFVLVVAGMLAVIIIRMKIRSNR